MEAEMGSIEIRMPEGSGMTGFPVMGKAICWTVPVARSFGEFAEKTIQCNAAARHAIDQVCRQGGFTQAWAGDEGPTFTMTKIPAIILVKLMLGLPEAQEKEVQSLIGAYAICMDPDIRTCMNVVVGRRPNGSGGFVLDKFSLYYPDNAPCYEEWGEKWDLLQGYSFRTAALSGSLNRAGLNGLRYGSIRIAEGAPEFSCDEHGLIIDDESAYEDCAYVKSVEGESAEARAARIDGMVRAMVDAYGSQGILSASFDPAEQAMGLTALEGEWNLLQAVAARAPASAAPDAGGGGGGAAAAAVEAPEAFEVHMSTHGAAVAASMPDTPDLAAHFAAHQAKITPAEEAVPPVVGTGGS